jgi:hypothetical protein
MAKNSCAQRGAVVPLPERSALQVPSKAARNVGVETLGIIHRKLMIDEGWTHRRERGFTWWAHRLPQHIDAGRPIEDDGIVVTRITSRIPILSGVKAEPDLVEKVLAAWNFTADSCCYVYDTETRSIESVQSSIVHEQTLEWRSELLASYFIIQLCHAEEDASVLRRALGGRIASSRHPVLGRRKQEDAMLNVVWSGFRPLGEGKSSFADKFEFEAIGEQVNRINAASFGGGDTGVAIEVPFGATTALITLNAAEENPRIGAGLGVFLQLPIFTSFEECVRLAAWLNRKEAAGEFLSQCIGAWSVKKGERFCTMARCEFIPNALHRPGLAMDAAIGAMMKLKQVNRLMNPGVEEPIAWKVVADRLGIEGPRSEEPDYETSADDGRVQ